MLESQSFTLSDSDYTSAAGSPFPLSALLIGIVMLSSTAIASICWPKTHTQAMQCQDASRWVEKETRMDLKEDALVVVGVREEGMRQWASSYL